MPLSLFGADHKPALRARRDRKAVGTAEVTRGSESENKGEGGGAGGGATEEPGGAAGGGGPADCRTETGVGWGGRALLQGLQGRSTAQFRGSAALLLPGDWLMDSLSLHHGLHRPGGSVRGIPTSCWTCHSRARRDSLHEAPAFLK